MERLKTIYTYLKEKYLLLVEKKYTTLAGTLVFFLVMAIMPLAVWLTLVFGKLNLPVDELIEMPVFSSVKNVLLYLRKEARTQTSGASFFLIATALYSATGLFYHLRRSGELIYGYNRVKSGWKIRISAVFVTFAVMILSVLSVLLIAFGTLIFNKLFTGWIASTLGYLLMIAVSFFLVLLLNAYACPYKVPLKEYFLGSFLTAGAWAVALVGFAVYLKFGNTGRLYGALSAVIVFMLWLYVLTVCFVSGMILGSEKIKAKESKKL